MKGNLILKPAPETVYVVFSSSLKQRVYSNVKSILPVLMNLRSYLSTPEARGLGFN